MRKEISKFFMATKSMNDWQKGLAKQEHWKCGYSAMELARSWEDANDFPTEIRKSFRESGIKTFEDIELLLAIPEYKVPLPPEGEQPTQPDIFILARADCKLVAIAVEGKKSESFGDLVSKWLGSEPDKRQAKITRLNYLCDKLQIEGSQAIDLYYQLMHRTVSSLLLAEKFMAQDALMLVHSFSEINKHFCDFERFANILSCKVEKDTVVFAKKIGEVSLYLAWVNGAHRL